VRVAETEENMANVCMEMGQLEKALETYERVLKTKCSTYGNAHATVAKSPGPGPSAATVTVTLRLALLG
jgi:hypothetical protein